MRATSSCPPIPKRPMNTLTTLRRSSLRIIRSRQLQPRPTPPDREIALSLDLVASSTVHRMAFETRLVVRCTFATCTKKFGSEFFFFGGRHFIRDQYRPHRDFSGNRHRMGFCTIERKRRMKIWIFRTTRRRKSNSRWPRKFPAAAIGLTFVTSPYRPRSIPVPSFFCQRLDKTTDTEQFDLREPEARRHPQSQRSFTRIHPTFQRKRRFPPERQRRPMSPSYAFTPRKRPPLAPFDRHRNAGIHQNRIRNFTIAMRNAQKQIVPRHPHRDGHHRTLRIPRNGRRHPRQNITTTQDDCATGMLLQSRTRRQCHAVANLIRARTRPQHRKELRPVNRGRNRCVHIDTNRTKEDALTTSHPRARHRRSFKRHTQSAAPHSHTTSRISRDRDAGHRRHRHKRATRRTQREIHRTLPHPAANHQRSRGALYQQSMSTTHHGLVIPEIANDTTRSRHRRRRIPTHTGKHRTIIVP